MREAWPAVELIFDHTKAGGSWRRCTDAYTPLEEWQHSLTEAEDRAFDKTYVAIADHE